MIALLSSGEVVSVAGRIYVAIDLKSFYASVECVDRGLDPLTTNLVVADESRTDKTICLAVSPSLKAYGIPGRPRLFEVVQKVREINAQRERHSPEGKLYVRIYDDTVTRSDPTVAVDYIVAPPRMARYKQVSTDIYKIYLKYVAPEHIHVYSIDEVFMDVTEYLTLHKMTAHELAMTMIRDVLHTTGITATAGIGTNLFLAKVAMDVVAKHIPADRDGVRIAELDEMEYRRQLWPHQPITDIWRVGSGIAKKLAAKGMYTMGDVARCSEGSPLEYYNEELLYEMFGVNAELLIDHAWGWEPCTMQEIKTYRSESSSLGSGQVLQRPYDFDGGKLIVREMTDLLVLDMVDKGLVTNQVVLTIGYDIENLSDPERRQSYSGAVVSDHYGPRYRSTRTARKISRATHPPRGRSWTPRCGSMTVSSIPSCWCGAYMSSPVAWCRRVKRRRSRRRSSLTCSRTIPVWRSARRKTKRRRQGKRNARAPSSPCRRNTAKTPSSKA